MYTSRLVFESKLREAKKLDLAKSQQLEFKPKVSKLSKDIALRYRAKLEDMCHAKLTTLDWLMQPNKNPNWQETAKEIIEGERMKECTFKPETKDYKRDKSKSTAKTARGRING